MKTLSLLPIETLSNTNTNDLENKIITLCKKMNLQTYYHYWAPNGTSDLSFFNDFQSILDFPEFLWPGKIDEANKVRLSSYGWLRSDDEEPEDDDTYIYMISIENVLKKLSISPVNTIEERLNELYSTLKNKHDKDQADKERDRLRSVRREKHREARDRSHSIARELNYDPFFVGTYHRDTNTYETEKFTFNLDKCEAWSYHWWMFVKRIGNTIYVNSIGYSMQTAQHQKMAENILKMADVEGNGLKIVYVLIKSGLQGIEIEISNVHFEIKQIKEKMANPKSQKKANKNRVITIKQLEKKIIKLEKLNKIIQRGK